LAGSFKIAAIFSRERQTVNTRDPSQACAIHHGIIIPCHCRIVCVVDECPVAELTATRWHRSTAAGFYDKRTWLSFRKRTLFLILPGLRWFDVLNDCEKQ
jgi:hypothetical protein